MFYPKGPDPCAAYRPKGHLLMTYLRAAIVDAGDAGPWLTLTRSHQGVRVYVHHLSLSAPDAFSTHRLVMCSGVEALGFACRAAWPSITEPTRTELRALGDWAVERVNASLWAANWDAWVREFTSPEAATRRAKEADDAAARVRALRWSLAEQWLRR